MSALIISFPVDRRIGFQQTTPCLHVENHRSTLPSIDGPIYSKLNFIIKPIPTSEMAWQVVLQRTSACIKHGTFREENTVVEDFGTYDTIEEAKYVKAKQVFLAAKAAKNAKVKSTIC